MNHKTLVDSTWQVALENLAEELSILLGQKLSWTHIRQELVTKHQLLGRAADKKSLLVRMTIAGERDGSGFILCRPGTAAALGGALILLPEETIAENTAKGILDRELTDAFTEVTRVSAGILTRSFAGNYPQALQFTRQEIEELLPERVDPDSSSPFPPGDYYVTAGHIRLGGRDIGLLQFVMPAELFDFSKSAVEVAADAALARPAPPLAAASPRPEPDGPDAVPAPAPPARTDDVPSLGAALELAERAFTATIERLADEIGLLLGQEISCADLQLQTLSRAGLVSSCALDKAILTELPISGKTRTSAWLITRVPDTITLGATLIMLPAEQIQTAIGSGRFAGEIVDAFAEVAQVAADGLSVMLHEHYPARAGAVACATPALLPAGSGAQLQQLFAVQHYCLISFTLRLADRPPQNWQLIVPAAILDLDPAQRKTAADKASGEGPGSAAGDPIILVISDRREAADPFEEALRAAGWDCRVRGFQEDVRDLFRQHRVQGIYLVMSQVGEKGFAAAIKLRSVEDAPPPLIVAGSQWTRSAVLKAIRYGARDVLVTPASAAEIKDKAKRHFRQER